MSIIHTFVFHVVVQQVFLICRILDIICVENSGRTGRWRWLQVSKDVQRKWKAVDAIPLLMWEQDPNWKFMKAPLTPRGTWAPTLYVDWSIFDNFWLFERAVQQSVRLCSRLTQFWSAERHIPTVMACANERRHVLIGRHTPPEVYRHISAAWLVAAQSYAVGSTLIRSYWSPHAAGSVSTYFRGSDWLDAYRAFRSHLTYAGLTCLPWHVFVPLWLRRLSRFPLIFDICQFDVPTLTRPYWWAVRALHRPEKRA